MAQYRIYTEIAVQVISEPIEADSPFEAYQRFHEQTDLEVFLRDVVGSKEISSVEFDGRRLNATVERLDDEGDGLQHVLKLGENELEEF